METIDFYLPFGRHKGKAFSSTPESYRRWLLQQDFFDINRQRPIMITKRNADGTWREAAKVTTRMKQTVCETDIDPEQRYYAGHTTYLERDSDRGQDY